MNRKGADSAKGRIGPFEFLEPSGGHRLTEDTVALVEFASPFSSGDTVVDLGTGSGAIPLLILSKTKVKRIVGVEADEVSAAAAEENSRRNGNVFDVVHTDWRSLRDKFRNGSFSVVISNPPYIKAGHGRLSKDERRMRARSETLGTLMDLLETTDYLLSSGGRACFVFPLKRKDELLNGLAALKFTEKRVKEAGEIFFVEAEKK